MSSDLVLLEESMPELVNQVKGIIGKLPETGLYEPNVKQFQIFVKHLIAGVANSPRATMLHSINKYFTDIYDSDIEAKWLAIFITDSKFRMKYQQSLSHAYESNPDISVSEFIARTANVIAEATAPVKRDYQGNIYVMNLHHGIQRLTYGLIFRKYKSAIVISESEPIERSPGFERIVETINQTTDDQSIREQRIARIIEDDRHRKEKAIATLPTYEQQLKTSPQYQLWLHATTLWTKYGLDTRVDEFVQFDKEIGKQRNQRGVAFEYEKSNRAFLLAMRKLYRQVKIGLATCGTIEIPVALSSTKYNRHLSRCSVDYGRAYPSSFTHSNMSLEEFEKANSDWKISYEYVMGAKWKDGQNVHIGEIDVTCVIVFTRIFSKSETFDYDVANLCNMTFKDIEDQPFVEVEVRQVIALIEMKSKCFEINSAFKQHEIKMTVQGSMIDVENITDFFKCDSITCDNPTLTKIPPSFTKLNIWYQHDPEEFNPNPSIFVTTLIAENDFIIGLSGKVTLDVANAIFDEIAIVDDLKRLGELLDRVRHKHSTYISPMEIVTNEGHRILVIS